MNQSLRKCVPALAGVLVIASILVARGLSPDTFQRLQLFCFDTLQRVEPWVGTSAAVRVVDIDDESLKRLGQWPWSRSTVAAMVGTLQDLGAASIAFDVVFAEPDRTSPAALAKSWGTAFHWEPAPGSSETLPDYDKDLAAVFRRGRVVTGFGMVAEHNGVTPAVPASMAEIGGDPAATVQNFGGAIASLPALEAAAAGNGSFAITASRDQVIRRLPLLLALNGKLVPALALEALRVARDEDTIGVRAEHNGEAVTGYTAQVGDVQIPIDTDGSLILHHGPQPSDAMVSAWRLLDPDQRQALARAIGGHIVLIGTSAVGLSDLRSTPLNPLEPGVNLHAGALEQILAQHFLSRPTWAPGAEYVGSALLAFGLVLLVGFWRLRTALAAGAASIAAVIGAAWWGFATFRLLLDPSLVVLTVGFSVAVAAFARYCVAERDAAKLRSAFTHYLSPALVEALARDPGRLKLGGELRDMTFLFTDLEGFTSLIEASDPKAIVALLNAYLDGLCRIAIDHGGTIDKIVGDAVHVMFNAPLDQADHAERGVRCALAIDAFAQGYCAAQKAAGTRFGVTRIGVNTGPAVVGNFGGSRRFDYTAHGDAINTAARLESANKALGTRICVSRSTADQVGAVTFLPVGTLMLKGKANGVEVFSPLTPDADAPPWRAAYLNAFARLLDGDDAAAAAAMLALHEAHPDHPILALHARRLRAGERSLRMAA